MTKSNPQITALIDLLHAAADEHETALWRDFARRLQKSSCRWAAVNVEKIAKHLLENEIALVPGKVLGDGTAAGIKVAAINFSAQARQKIEAAGGTCYTIPQLVEQHADGRNIRIIGG
jgi:large subunit ribosomal protein L18e